MKLIDLRNNGIKDLKINNIDDPIIKVDILLKHILNMSKIEIIINFNKEVENSTVEKFNKNIQKIIKGEPIQYITNLQEFMNLKFYVDKNVLIPQPDTEILVEKATEIIENIILSKCQYGVTDINRIIKKEVENSVVNENRSEGKVKQKIKVLDLCTGSGAIAVTLENYILTRYNNKIVEIFASDISKKALEIAQKNAILNNKISNIIFIESDMFENISENKFDVIISNPPYIETGVISSLSEEVKNEPHIALDGGENGLKFYEIIAKNAINYLNDNGYLLLEIGYNQKIKVEQLLEKNNYSKINCIKDLAGKDRVIIAQKVKNN